MWFSLEQFSIEFFVRGIPDLTVQLGSLEKWVICSVQRYKWATDKTNLHPRPLPAQIWMSNSFCWVLSEIPEFALMNRVMIEERDQLPRYYATGCKQTCPIWSIYNPSAHVNPATEDKQHCQVNPAQLFIIQPGQPTPLVCRDNHRATCQL